MIDLSFGVEKNTVWKNKFKIFLLFILSNVWESLRMIFNFDSFDKLF